MSVDNTFQTIRKAVIDRKVTMFLYMVIVLLIFLAWCLPNNTDPAMYVISSVVEKNDAFFSFSANCETQ